MQKRQEIVASLDRRIARLDSQMAELDAYMKEGDAKLREDLAAEIDAIRKKRREVERRLAELRLQDAEAWDSENLESGMFAVLDDIGARIGKLVGRSS